MPALQNVVLTDRAATPVAHTFTPRDIKDGVAMVVKPDVTGLPISEMRYSISSRRTGDRIKTTVKFVLPIVQTETINGVSKPIVVRESYVDATFNFSASSTEAERNNVVGMFADSFAASKVLINDTVVKGQGIWGA